MMVDDIADLSEVSWARHDHDDLADRNPYHVAVLPCATLKQARELVRVAAFWGRTESERIEALKPAFRETMLCFTMPENEAILTKGLKAMLSALAGRPRRAGR